MTSCYTLTLCDSGGDANGKGTCTFPDELINKCSWLNPTIEEVGGPDEETMEPTSPKIAKRKRRNPEKRANAYAPLRDEELFRPVSRNQGMLLLRPDSSFAYVHDAEARFSEGVQGVWSLRSPNVVALTAQDFGWCYQESFDDDEVIGTCHSITLCRDAPSEDGKFTCILSD